MKTWHSTLKLSYEKHVEAELTRIGYPFSHGNTNADIANIRDAFLRLDELDLPPHLRDESEPPLPIQLLTRPLKKKFRVFFYSNASKLNDPTKPEYYLSVILRWLNDNRRFVHMCIEELFVGYSASYEFAVALVRLGSEKVKNHLRIIDDDDVFSHLIDEVLSHDADLIEFEPRLIDSPRPILVIENDDTFVDRWLRLEIVSARERCVNI